MFTSRAEYRLRLRADNADERLTPVGRQLGIVDDARWARFERRRRSVAAVRELCNRGQVDGIGLASWIRRPEADPATLADALVRVQGHETFCVDALEQILIAAKYDGYVDRQARQIERFRRLESLAIPPGVDFAALSGLRIEARERLAQVTPGTLGQAARTPGINPADITALWIHLAGRARRES